ncbi:MAG: hypothetical protein N3E40_06325 [Dehalococcoidia bacterium]|nr:hypothetical protein [Dehalococcoidia bacterium]
MRPALAILILVSLLASIIPASPATAAPPTKIKFNEVLAIQYIGAGDIRQVGNPNGNYYWLVKDRPAEGVIRTGNFFPSGTFSFVYSGLFRPDQSGRAEGTLTLTTPAGTAIAKVTTSIGATAPVGIALKDGQPFGIVVKASFSSAHFAFSKGTGAYRDLTGIGTFTGDTYTILDMSGTHVIAFADGTYPVVGFDGSYLGNPASLMTMTGSGVIG